MALQASVARHSQASTSVEKRDLQYIQKTAEVLRHGLKSKALAYVVAGRERSLCMQYGSDCTPLITKERHAQQLEEVKVVRGGHQAT